MIIFLKYILPTSMAGVPREQNTLILGRLESHAQEIRSLNNPTNIYELPKLIPNGSGGTVCIGFISIVLFVLVSDRMPRYKVLHLS